MPRASKRLELTEEEERALLAEIKGGNGRVVRRAQILRLLAQGLGATEIGSVLGVSIASVHQLRKAFLNEGLSALHDKPIPGRPPKATEVYIECLKDAVAKSPRDFGYVFSCWTLARLREHLARKCKILMSEPRLSGIMRKHGLVYMRPRHVMAHLRDQTEYHEKKELLAFLKKKRPRPTLRLISSSSMSVRFTSTRP